MADTRSAWAWAGGGAAILALTVGAWTLYNGGLALPLGSIRMPTPGHVVFIALWWTLGAAAVALIARGIVALGPGARRWLIRRWEGPSPPVFVGVAAVFAVLLGVAVGQGVFLGGPVTDDASVYRFMAGLLARGQVAGVVPPEPELWDRAFMVTTDRWYGHFFLGWPALLAPFEAVGLPGLANPLLHGATVPAVYLALRRAVSEPWARGGVLLFVLSPVALLLAGSLLAHTATMCALAWALVALHRALDRHPPLWADASFAVALSVAFCCRPLTALGIGLPWVVLWLLSVLRRRRWVALVAFGLPVAAFAAVFLGTIAAQTGSPLRPAYAALLADADASGWRFSHLRAAQSGGIDGIRLWNPPPLTTMLIGGVRLAVAAWGIPLVIVALLRIPWSAREARPHLLAILGFTLTHAFLGDPGIDTLGPVHVAELLLPATVLLVLAGERAVPRDGAWPGALLVAGILASLLVYTPVRLWTGHQVARAVHRTTDVVARAPGPAIVYVPLGPYTRSCEDGDPLPFVFWRPNPRPDLSDPVLQANHLDVPTDRAHRARHFPDRRAFVLVRDADACSPVLVDLDGPAADGIGPGRVRLPGPAEAIDPNVRALPGTPPPADAYRPDR